MNKDDIKKKSERSEICIAYYNTYNLDDDSYGYFDNSFDRYGSDGLKPVDDVDDIDTEIPMFYGSKKYYNKIIETLESDNYFLRAKRIEIPASITACPFYRKMGYTYKNGIDVVDEELLFRLEKFR